MSAIILSELITDTAKRDIVISKDIGLLNIVVSQISIDGRLIVQIGSKPVQNIVEFLSGNAVDTDENKVRIKSSIDKFITAIRNRADKDSTLNVLLTELADQYRIDNRFRHYADRYRIEISDSDLNSIQSENAITLGLIRDENRAVGDRQYLDRTYDGRFIVSSDTNANKPGIKDHNAVFTGVDLQIVTISSCAVLSAMRLKTVTYSMHAGLIPVGSLGRDKPKGFAKGDRTVAGTLIATVAVEDPLMKMQPIIYTDKAEYRGFEGTRDVWRTYLLPDQLPIFDIIMFFSNEHGNKASMSIFGIKITDMGSVISMSDSEIEVTYTYTALDLDIIRSLSVENTQTGTLTIDELANKEYELKRQRAYSGMGLHRSIYEVPSLMNSLNSAIVQLGREG